MRRNKPCGARHLEYVGRFEVALEVCGLPLLLSHLPLMIRYYCVSGMDFSCSDICQPKRDVLSA